MTIIARQNLKASFFGGFFYAYYFFETLK